MQRSASKVRCRGARSQKREPRGGRKPCYRSRRGRSAHDPRTNAIPLACRFSLGWPGGTKARGHFCCCREKQETHLRNSSSEKKKKKKKRSNENDKKVRKNEKKIKTQNNQKLGSIIRQLADRPLTRGPVPAFLRPHSQLVLRRGRDP